MFSMLWWVSRYCWPKIHASKNGILYLYVLVRLYESVLWGQFGTHGTSARGFAWYQVPGRVVPGRVQVHKYVAPAVQSVSRGDLYEYHSTCTAQIVLYPKCHTENFYVNLKGTVRILGIVPAVQSTLQIIALYILFTHPYFLVRKNIPKLIEVCLWRCGSM